MSKKTKKEATEEKVVTKSVIDPKIKKAYGKSQSCNDDVATRLKQAMEINSLERIAADNGININRWEHLNKGMQRMNLGNVLRGMANRGEQVNIVV